MCDAAAAALAEPPPIDLSLKDVAATAEWTERLGGISLAPGHVRVPFGARVETLAGFAEGGWWVQDLAASLPARVLGAKAGDRVLDLCAAPGGKTMQLAALGAAVTAVELNSSRLARLREKIGRASCRERVCQYVSISVVAV